MRNKHKQKRLIFVGATLAISLVAMFFIVTNFRENIVFFYSPSELKDLKNTARTIRIGGLVKEGSVKKIDAMNAQFVVTDLQEEIKISYQGILPELFRDNQGVVAKGVLSEDKTEFLSRELLVKHDEKYMPPEVAKSLKNVPKN